MLRGVERSSPCSLEVVRSSFILILRSLCKKTYTYFRFFLFYIIFLTLCFTLAFLPLECLLFPLKQFNNLNNLMTHNTLFTLNWNRAANPLVC